MSENFVVDARGLSCPTPVVRTKKALKEHSSFDVLVDAEVAKENVSRFCEREKAKIDVSKTDDGWKISVTK